MFLSNPRKFFLLASSFVLILQACGSSSGTENKPAFVPIETKSEFPFSTKEPEVYQGDFVVITGANETRWFMARRGDNWRFDTYYGTERLITELKTDQVYHIDHQQKLYAAAPQSAITAPPAPNVFSGKQYHEFEEIAQEGDIVRYKVKNSDVQNDEILISMDKASGMIVRQEFTGRKTETGLPVSYVYEIRNLKLEADDSVFAIPTGYRKVTWEEFRSARTQLHG